MTVSYAPNLWISSSDYYIRKSTNVSSKRYKTDIEDLKDEKLNPNNLYKLKIKQFKYRKDFLTDPKDSRYDKLLIGFIAEDVEEIYPVATDYEIDKDGNKIVDNWNEKYIIPAMLKLLQDQHEEIKKLKEEIEKLKGGK